MWTRLRTALLLTVAGVLAAGVAPAYAAAPPLTTWSSDLRSGEAAGVTTRADAVVLDQRTARPMPPGAHPGTAGRTAMTEGAPDPDPAAVRSTGLLTLAPHTLAHPTDRVDSMVVADLPPGSTVTVDVRGRRAGGNWTEWIPSTSTGTTYRDTAGTATLPEPITEVQSRLVLAGTPDARPLVRDLRQAAHPTSRTTAAAVPRKTLSSRVFATREGLVGGTTANGHVITERDHFVALPSRRALSPRGTSDYSVKVCTAGGRCAFAPVWDVGPWNTRDDYWNPGTVRQNWADLPQGLPEAQAAYRNGYNGGKDQFGRKVVNPAGIDLADGLFWDALGLRDNAWVTVDYLWTGSARLAEVAAKENVPVRAAPSRNAEQVGIAVRTADVPVECVTGTAPNAWLRIGAGQFVAASAVSGAGAVGACPAAG
ncbi:hypothetical protein PA7_02140 [Pseudonocardia asaccharolytica DSM 44247 = NBRC 16224]|uniref:Secreted protein n=2 Tax=Pseudonocardia asaccharolytica TaxID=54010 RepID=A0A511CVB0_9PSEU|nr:hypothetical protein PA7_02140 [Pseudonocardia asaccharolytica DSM 44247 = NBRC 16224]